MVKENRYAKYILKLLKNPILPPSKAGRYIKIMNSIKIRNLELGAGTPAICIPNTGKTKEEAKLIIDQAKKNASHIINDALIKAEKTELEADQLRRSLKIYKARIKQTIEEQLTMVNDVDHIQMEREGEK